MTAGPTVAVVGATGVVGAELLRILEERAFPIGTLRLLASSRSAGRSLDFAGTAVPVEALREDAFTGVDLALFACGGEASRAFAPAAVRAGAVVVDNSSAFRMQPDVPLVVPEINPGALVGHRGIVANPNCSTILFLMAVHALHRETAIERAVVCTYQAVSGSGRKGLDELRIQQAALAAGEEPVARAYPKPIAGNVLPFVERLLEGGYSPEEIKLHNETTKILGDPRVRVSATCVRVPVERAHAEAIHLELSAKVPVARVRDLVAASPGVRLLDDPDAAVFPTPRDAAGGDDVLVGRIREDLALTNGIALFATMDQLRKGAALNAIQIAEELRERSLLGT